MKLLLDSHTFLWWADDPDKLTEAVMAACHARANELILSVVSVWEIQIKVQLGKLRLSAPLADIVLREQNSNDLRLLPISLRTCARRRFAAFAPSQSV